MKKLYFYLVIILLCQGLTVNANSKSVQFQQIDTIQQNMNDSIDSMLDFQSDYLVNTEVEHQKLIRNIFIGGFAITLLLLIFTIFFYGSKIKKVSNIIILQNDLVNSTKDQLVKVINIFNYIDDQIYITDSKGNIEWMNSYATNYFTEDIEKNKISLIQKFKTENQGLIFQGINENSPVIFEDIVFEKNKEWKMVPIKNSKGEFSNMVFICSM